MSFRVAISVLACAGLLSADTLVLKNGSTIQGSFISGADGAVRFSSNGQVNRYDVSQIDFIRFDSTSTSANPRRYDTSVSDPQSPSRNSNANRGTAPTGTIPAGTNVVVRMIDNVDSQEAHVGQTFQASLDQPVMLNGQTVLPQGADVTTVLTEAKSSGKFEGKASLMLDIQSIHANGRDYRVQTTGVVEASSGRGNRTTKVVGGTAALGAIIGAIAGGGKGAAIGAGAGAATGAGVQAATSGQRVRIPSETRLTFTLQNDLQL